MPAPPDILRQRARIRVVAQNVGKLTMVWALLIVVPMAVAFRTHQNRAGLWYAGIAATALVVGFLLSRLRAPQRIQTNEAMVIGSSLFLLSPLAMTAPMMAMGIPFIDAYFEAVSGVTTTGLSTLPSVETHSTLFLFARSWTQWYGGLGIVALALALVTQPGTLARRLSLTEGYQEDTLGSSRAYFRSTLTTYTAITVLGISALWMVGASGFDAVVYALAAVSTGGFAAHDTSLAGLGGPPLHIAVIALCLAGAVPLAVYSRAARGHVRDLWTDPQLRALLIAGALISILLTLSMSIAGNVPLKQALTHGPVMAFSAHTTAGFASVNIQDLDAGSKLLMIVAMAVGGGAGSTAGGIKVLRFLILLRVLQGLFERLRLPKHAVFEPSIAGKHIDRSEIQDALTVVLLFASTVLLSWLAFVIGGYDPLDALFEVTSATGTVGLSAGVTSMEMPAILKLVLCADMILGRLELIALFVVFAPRTWMPRPRSPS